jgi:hypothetical protein
VWAGVTRSLVGVVLVVLAVVLAGPVAQGQAVVTPSSGGPWAAFEVTFPAQAVVLDVQLTAPRGCGWLDDLTISIRRAQSGRFRFGPRVAGARPRRDGRRLRRWCRGNYRVAVVRSGEFEPSGSEVVSGGRFTVK